MNNNEFIDKFAAYLSSKKKKDGTDYGYYYKKDNLVRLKKLLTIKPTLNLDKIDDSNLDATLERVVKLFPPNPSNKRFFPYAAYNVVVRIIYEMNTGKKPALYSHYNFMDKNKRRIKS